MPPPPPYRPASLEPSADRGRPVARRYHIHSALVTYCLVALLMSIGAFNSNNNLLFWLFFLSLAMVIVSGFISGAMLMNVRLEREAVPHGAAGGAVTLRYRVSNVGRWAPVFAVTITEHPSALDPDDQQLRAKGQFDRPPIAFAAHAAARSSVEVEAPVTLASRGMIRLDQIVITSEFPFGIVRKSVRFSQPAVLVVRPKPITPSEIPVRPRAGAGSDQSAADRRSGAGEHFFALREYFPGDNPRTIAWKASARATESIHSGLLVRQTTAARPRQLLILLDLTVAKDEASYEEAISRTAGAILQAEKSGIQVGLSVILPDAEKPLEFADPRSGRWHVSRLLNELGLLPNFKPASGPPHEGTPVARPQAKPGRDVLVIAPTPATTGAAS